MVKIQYENPKGEKWKINISLFQLTQFNKTMTII